MRQWELQELLEPEDRAEELVELAVELLQLAVHGDELRVLVAREGVPVELVPGMRQGCERSRQFHEESDEMWPQVSEFWSADVNESQTGACGGEMCRALVVGGESESHGWASESEAYLGAQLENLISSAGCTLTPSECLRVLRPPRV